MHNSKCNQHILHCCLVNESMHNRDDHHLQENCHLYEVMDNVMFMFKGSNFIFN